MMTVMAMLLIITMAAAFLGSELTFTKEYQTEVLLVIKNILTTGAVVK